MQNDMKDRLISLLNVAVGDSNLTDNEVKIVADYLIANGVVLPPCNVGQTVYFIDFEDDNQIKALKIDHLTYRNCTSYFGDGEIESWEILSIPAHEERKGQSIPLKKLMEDWFGEYVLPTKTQAEQKLKELRENADL